MEMKNKAAMSGSTFRKPSLMAALLLTALSLSGCVVAQDRDGHGGWRGHRQWNDDGGWHGGPGDGWQGNRRGSWDDHH